MENNLEYTIEKAGLDDLDTVLYLLKNASKWLKSKGLQQWDYYLTDMEGNLKEISDSIRKGSTYLLFIENRGVGTLTLESLPNEWDCELWGAEADEDGCMYLHRLVVEREWKGKGFGDICLDWAESFCQENGYEKIRFDCLHSNNKLNHYYQRRFTLKETVHIHGVHNKYEKIVLEPRKSGD
jgi:GNAT superfamily N-acetyltransferase